MFIRRLSLKSSIKKGILLPLLLSFLLIFGLASAASASEVDCSIDPLGLTKFVPGEYTVKIVLTVTGDQIGLATFDIYP